MIDDQLTRTVRELVQSKREAQERKLEAERIKKETWLEKFFIKEGAKLNDHHNELAGHQLIVDAIHKAFTEEERLEFEDAKIQFEEETAGLPDVKKKQIKDSEEKIQQKIVDAKEQLPIIISQLEEKTRLSLSNTLVRLPTVFGVSCVPGFACLAC